MVLSDCYCIIARYTCYGKTFFSHQSSNLFGRALYKLCPIETVVTFSDNFILVSVLTSLKQISAIFNYTRNILKHIERLKMYNNSKKIGLQPQNSQIKNAKIEAKAQSYKMFVTKKINK